MVNYTVEFVDKNDAFINILERINNCSLLALDIETINWWDREAERVAIIQIAFREGDNIIVAVIDTLVGLNIEPLRTCLELSLKTKVIHNAAFDATRIARHYGIRTSPIFDTMVAARRNKEKPASLKAQVERHLGVALDKEQQQSDWGKRPLEQKQLRYAALDAVSTLLLYEHQLNRGLSGDYTLSADHKLKHQKTSPSIPVAQTLPTNVNENIELSSITKTPLHDLSSTIAPISMALLGIVSELSGRYSPEQLAASLDHDRIGIAGWIVDKILGVNELIDEEDARLGIALLCEQGLTSLSLSRRLEATPAGIELWKKRL